MRSVFPSRYVLLLSIILVRHLVWDEIESHDFTVIRLLMKLRFI